MAEMPSDASPQRFDLEFVVWVKIDVRDRSGVVTRYTEGGEEHPYGCETEDQILDHLAYNAIANGVQNANRLDGWADLSDDAAEMHVEFVERA